MEIITDFELASYLESELTGNLTLKTDLANGIIEDLVGTLTVVPVRVRAIAFEVAGRAVRNPGGYASEGGDDYRYSLPSETRKAGVYLTDSERVELLGVTGQVTASIYTVPLGGPDVFW